MIEVAALRPRKGDFRSGAFVAGMTLCEIDTKGCQGKDDRYHPSLEEPRALHRPSPDVHLAATAARLVVLRYRRTSFSNPMIMVPKTHSLWWSPMQV